MGSKDDTIYMEQAIIDINAVIGYTKGYSYEQFISDIKTIDATMFRLQQMIEKIKNLSLDFKINHEDILWGDIVGFRNGIVHEYGKTDYTTVYEIFTKDIFELKELFENEIKTA